MGNVGYKRPPTHSRFAKGESGNPAGRPKGTRKSNSLSDIIHTMVSVNVDGVSRKMPLNEATVMRLFQSALNGNTAAARLVLQLIEKAEAKKIDEESPTGGMMPPIGRIILAGPDFEGCSEALRRLDVIQANDKAYLIQSWVVEAALARKSRAHFSFDAEDCQKIAENMMNPVAWSQMWEKSE